MAPIIASVASEKIQVSCHRLRQLENKTDLWKSALRWQSVSEARKTSPTTDITRR